tara:strand:+ start:197 stop:478 length:282 start_codon:yes stop_codon:yes gene_type:complete
MPTIEMWQSGMDKDNKSLNQRFPFKTADATKKDFYEQNVALYWFGSYAIGIWYTLWFSYIAFGIKYNNCLNDRKLLGPEACTDYLGWLHRYNN